MAIGCVGLGCDSLLEREGEEPAEVAAKAEGKGGAAEAKVIEPGKALGESGKAVEPGKASVEPPGKAGLGVSTEAGKAVPGTPTVPAPPAVPAAPGVATPGVSTPAVPGTTTPAVPTEPGSATPATPTAPGVVVAPPPGTLSALPSTPSDTAFSEKMQRRLRSKLREQHDARTQLAASVALPHPDGSVTVLALYEYSVYEACVGQSDGSPEARKACANPTDDNERVLAALRKCTSGGLVRARFGPPPKSQPAYGGELAVEATHPLPGGCTVSQVRRFAVDDVDGDGQVELALDMVRKTPQTSFRSETPYDVFTRTAAFFRTDLSTQWAMDRSEWFNESLEEGNESTARRFRVEDTNGDGRADIVVDEVEYMNDGECDLDEVGWLKKVGADEDEPCGGRVVTKTLVYDRELDEWSDRES
jgi:hypothetical protein